jgi:glycosyltransferase involved in cell wall biosynthesis
LLKYKPKKIICVSKAIAEFYLPIGDEKTVVLYVASNVYKDLANVTYHHIASKRAEYGIRPTDVVIGYMGRLVAEKGPEDVVDAVLALLPDYPKIHCLIVGTGKNQMHTVEDQIIHTVQASQYADRIHLVGYQTDQALYYALFDIFVLATRDHEPFATSVVQAMMAGATVVGTNAGGTPELVRQGQTGLLYQPGDVVALTGALQQLLDDPERAKVLAEEGKRVVLADYKESQLARRAETIYLQAMGEKPMKEVGA